MQIPIATYTCSTEFRLSREIPQDKHYTIRDYLVEELVKARNLLKEKIGENDLKEFIQLCRHCLSCLEI